MFAYDCTGVTGRSSMVTRQWRIASEQKPMVATEQARATEIRCEVRN